MNKIFSLIRRLKALIASIDVDKLLHFTVGVIIASIVSILVTNLWWLSLPVVFVVALTCELVDKRSYGLFDFKDLVATVLGGLLIFLISFISHVWS